MTKELIIGIAFGEITGLFMSQDIKGTEMVMPTEELDRILKDTIDKLKQS